MDKKTIAQLIANIVGAAAAGYIATGTWQGALVAALASVSALFQPQPHK